LFAQLQTLIMQYFQQNDWIEMHRICSLSSCSSNYNFCVGSYCSTCYICISQFHITNYFFLSFFIS